MNDDSTVDLESRFGSQFKDVMTLPRPSQINPKQNKIYPSVQREYSDAVVIAAAADDDNDFMCIL